MKEQCCAIILAAGNSSRMGRDKLFISLRGKSVLEWSLQAFQAAEEVNFLVVVHRPEDGDEIKALAAKQVQKPICFVAGGKTRQESAAAGAAAALGAAWLAVHDGARCLVTAREIDDVIHEAKRSGAAALGVPVKDTIKIADPSGKILSTPDRSALWIMQTPQVFPAEEYLQEIRKAIREGREYTDDCQLWEYSGKAVTILRGEYTNIKLTTEEDTVLAETILRGRGGAV